MPTPLYLLAGFRTPFCRAGAELAGLSAVELGRQVAAALLARTGLPAGELDEVIFGCVFPPPEAVNVARTIALRAGVPEHVPAVTVQRLCASSLDALTMAAERVAAGRGSLYLVGGVESMSQVPLFFSPAAAAKYQAVARARHPAARAQAYVAFRAEDFTPRVGLALGLTDSTTGLRMGETAELLAREQGISRLAQDLFAVRSHTRALAARTQAAEEIAPVFLPGTVVAQDGGPRAGQTVERLAELKPAFDSPGTVTAGNSSPITDGAVALLVGTAERARALGLTPLARLVDYAYTGCAPQRMGLGPVSALAALQRRIGRRVTEAQVVEINEAFAAQVLAVLKELREAGDELPQDGINHQGGALALGHPVGATGARLVLTAAHQLRRRGGGQAAVALCVGGGQGAALWLESPGDDF